MRRRRPPRGVRASGGCRILSTCCTGDAGDHRRAALVLARSCRRSGRDRELDANRIGAKQEGKERTGKPNRLCADPCLWSMEVEAVAGLQSHTRRLHGSSWSRPRRCFDDACICRLPMPCHVGCRLHTRTNPTPVGGRRKEPDDDGRNDDAISGTDFLFSPSTRSKPISQR
jgi:hypothetical protein